MAIKTFKPYTPGRRNMTVSGFDGVDKKAKPEIKPAVETIFGVKVSKVNTVRMQGKVKRTGAYPAGRRPAYKKAIVTLTADSKTIELFEGMV